MSFLWRPQTVYGTGPTTFNFTRPCRLWLPGPQHHGGRSVSGAGIPEVYTIRRDELVRLVLRFSEGEWSDVHAFVTTVMESAEVFAFRFNQDDVATEYDVYLEEPTPNAKWAPSRGEYPGELELEIVLRNSAGVAFDVVAFI